MVLTGASGLRVPGLPSRAALVYLLGNGMSLVGANLLTLFSISIDNILIGRVLGVDQLGLYALACHIVRIPEAVLVGPILVTFLPAVARLAGDRRKAASLFLSTLRVMFGLAGIAVGVALAAFVGNAVYLGAAMREVPLSIRELVAALWPALASTTTMACGVGALRLLLPDDLSALVEMLLAVVAGIGLYIGTMQLIAAGSVAATIAPFRRGSRSHGH